jgi:hypothetical protein
MPLVSGIQKIGGRGEIRTHGGREPTTVFKTVALNRSATLPNEGEIIPKNYIYGRCCSGKITST